MKKLIIATGAVCLSAFLLSAQAYTGQELAKDAKINLQEARGIALKAYPGKITDFERFYRIAGNEVQGSGLGLAIVKQIVQRHGAFAEIATGENGIGAIFSIKFQSLSLG